VFTLRSGPKLDLTIFFATDIHGSNLCFRKVLAAPAFYHADVVILGGDLTGKMIVPLLQTARGWEARYASTVVPLETESAVLDFERSVSDAGYYPFRSTANQISGEDPTWSEHVFREQVIARLESWDELANGRFHIYVAPGNDDEIYIDEVLSSSKSFVNAESKDIDLPGGYGLFSTGWANITPWHTARELDEVALLDHLKKVLRGVQETDRAIFNIHVPPKDSGLDSCYEVNERHEVVTELGQPKLIGGGSTAVRDVLTQMQPLVSLHGHIHESRGMARIGRTVAVNPGSEYSEGILRGVLIKLRGSRVEEYQFTSG
jgi:Icc-related predicted phosphoesterase